MHSIMILPLLQCSLMSALTFKLASSSKPLPSRFISMSQRTVSAATVFGDVAGFSYDSDGRGDLIERNDIFADDRSKYRPRYQNKISKYSPAKQQMRSVGSGSQGDSHRSSFISTTINLVDRGRAEEAVTFFFQSGGHDTMRISPLDCQQLMRALGEGGYFQECDALLKNMERVGIRRCVITYSLAISRAGKWKQVELAEKYFKQMISEGIQPDVQAYNSLINAYAKRGDTDKAMSILTAMESAKVSPSIVTYNTLIDSCAKSGRNESVKQALLIIGMMYKKGFKPNLRSYSALIHACCQARELESALNILVRMEKEGVYPTSVTYSTLVHGLGKSGDLTKAFQLLESMKLKGFTPNVVTMSSLVHSCARHGRMDKAFSLYDDMLMSEFPEDRPNSITCSSLIDACLKAGRVDDAFRLLHDMKSRRLRLTEVTYTSLISELTRLKQLGRISEVTSFQTNFNALLSHDIGDIVAASTPVALASADTGRPSEALASADTARPGDLERILREKEKDKDNCDYQTAVTEYDTQKSMGVAPDARVYRALMQSLSREPTAPLHVLKNSQQMHPHTQPLVNSQARVQTQSTSQAAVTSISTSLSIPSTSISSAAAAAVEGPRDPESASSGTRVKFEPESSAGLGNLSVERREREWYVENMQKKRDNLFRLYLVFQEMRDSGIEPDTTAYNTLINACADAGDLNQALETVKTMQNEGFAPDVITYTSLIKACGVNGTFGTAQLAEEIFASMQQRTNHFSSYIEPTELTFQRLMQAHLRWGNVSEVVSGPPGNVSPAIATSTKRVWELKEDMQRRGLKLGIAVYRYCARAALLNNDIDRALATLLVIQHNTRLGYDFKSWLDVANACGARGMIEEEARLRREILSKRMEYSSAKPR